MTALEKCQAQLASLNNYGIQDDGTGNIAFKKTSCNFKKSIKQVSNENKS